MTQGQWARRVGVSPELQEVRRAGEDLGRQARHAPGRTGPAFQSVSEILLLGTCVISGVLGLVHLWQALNRPHPADHHRHESPRRASGATPHRQPHDGGQPRRG